MSLLSLTCDFIRSKFGTSSAVGSTPAMLNTLTLPAWAQDKSLPITLERQISLDNHTDGKLDNSLLELVRAFDNKYSLFYPPHLFSRWQTNLLVLYNVPVTQLQVTVERCEIAEETVVTIVNTADTLYGSTIPRDVVHHQLVYSTKIDTLLWEEKVIKFFTLIGVEVVYLYQ